MPNCVTASALVETATKCFATAFASPSWPMLQSRAARALVSVSRVVKVFEQTMNSVSAASRSRVASTKSVPIDVGDEAKVEVALAVVAERLVGHHRTEVGAADADVDDVADALAAVAQPLPAAHRVGECGHAIEHRVDLGTTSTPSTTICSPCGARSATCSTERFSVALIASPRNIAAMRSRSPHSSASRTSKRQGLVGDAVLRVVEVETGGLEREALAAAGVGREQLAQVGLADLPVVRAQRLPSRALGQRRHDSIPLTGYGERPSERVGPCLRRPGAAARGERVDRRFLIWSLLRPAAHSFRGFATTARSTMSRTHRHPRAAAAPPAPRRRCLRA